MQTKFPIDNFFVLKIDLIYILSPSIIINQHGLSTKYIKYITCSKKFLSDFSKSHRSWHLISHPISWSFWAVLEKFLPLFHLGLNCFKVSQNLFWSGHTVRRKTHTYYNFGAYLIEHYQSCGEICMTSWKNRSQIRGINYIHAVVLLGSVLSSEV